jgi:hypothetical protein
VGDWARFKLLLAAPVNGASLAVVRVAIGLVMALEAHSLCRPSAMMQGHIPLERYFTGPDIKFHLPYEMLGWLPLLPAPWIHALVGILALAGVSMALGFCYRASAVTVFLAWGYLFAVESTRTYWQSYYYVELLFTFLLIGMPAARRYSIDAWLARRQNLPRTVPYWTVFLLRGQLVIAYFYAGVSKLNLDWLLDAAPLRWNLADAHVATDLQPHLTAAQLDLVQGILHNATFAYFIAYAGVAFDLSIGFLLLIRRTRIFAMLLLVLFHATNHFVIYDNIDWFPLVGVTTALIFLDPDWPERLWSWLRRPRLATPDWSWLAAGTILFPVIGASLGWKSKPSRPFEDTAERGQVGRCAAPFVVVWLVWQTLMPLRHYLIPGDGRFTYEGLSFSWRLKADDHRALSVQVFVEDRAILARDDTGRMRIDWNQWHGERVLYRRITPGRINWQQLPEIVVLLEPLIGERVVYNPLAGSSAPRTEAESRERVRRIWQEFYGRQPQIVGPTALPQVLTSISARLAAAGLHEQSARLGDLVARAQQPDQNELETRRTHHAMRALLNDLRSRDEHGEMMADLQGLDPFALEGEIHRPSPFLLIEDAPLFAGSGASPRQVNRAAWKNGRDTGQRSPMDVYTGGEPLVVYMGDIGGDARHALPQACILDSQDHPERPPYIWWNSLRDLSPSKFMHISNQAFYLRRYARRIASLWEKDYARRPAVHAKTAVSLNGRPYQLLVDPVADLATVPVTRFGHNAWIRDMEMPRIPREALMERTANRSTDIR